MMLSALVLIPLIGAILIAFLPGKQENDFYRSLAILVAIILCIFTLVIGLEFNTNNPAVQFNEYLPWITGIGLNYHLGIDGLSFPLICLNSLLTLIAIYTSSKTIERSRFYYALILILNSGVAGAFLAQDLLLLSLIHI